MSLLKRSFPGVKSLVIPVILIIAGVTILYFLNQIYGSLYDAIQNYKEQAAWAAVASFCALAGIGVLVDSLKTFELNKLVMKMRTRLITSLVNTTHPTDETYNQRIQEDTYKLTEVTVELGTAFLEAALKIPLFIGVIVTLTNWWTGAIVLVAVVTGTILTKVISTGLVKARSDYESSEAILRRSVGIEDKFWKSYDNVLVTFKEFNQQLKKLTLLTGGLGQTFVLLPFILLLPLYFSKVLTLGAFFQSVKALDKIIQSLSVIIDNRNKITMYLTAKQRLESISNQKKD
jgi:ABC-type uncharacterized transport system fused permease/ATPase subunit